MQGDYRLFRQGGGIGAFAHVYVQVTTWDQTDDQVVLDVDTTDTATVSLERDHEWFAAAIQGCQDGLRALEAHGVSTVTYQVMIKRLLTNLVDTRPDAIRAAAFLATAQAFGKREIFKLVFKDEWTVVLQG